MKQNIIEGNKTIALFMGRRFYDSPITDGKEYFDMPMPMGIMELNKLSFHNDWNWLMPVIEKNRITRVFLYD